MKRTPAGRGNHTDDRNARSGDFGAIARLKAQIAAGRGGILSRIALGRALMQAGAMDEGLIVLREAVALSPGVAEAALALGEGLMMKGHLPTAIAEFRRALALDPGSEAAAYALGCAWFEAGEADRAIEIIRPLASRDGPAGRRAQEKLREAEAMKTLGRSPPGYVRHLFDQFSANYDSKMVQDLGYCAPSILRSFADLLLVGSNAPVEILDLGCGTGLAGEVFRPLARSLCGVDLSPLMIEQARQRGVYDELTVTDLESFLLQSHRRWELILAADTLVYFGELSAVFAGIRRSLQPNGHFLFTVEKHGEPGFAMGPKRRFRHSGAYIRAQAESTGLVCMGLLDCSPRTEAGTPVEGLAVALQIA